MRAAVALSLVAVCIAACDRGDGHAAPPRDAPPRVEGTSGYDAPVVPPAVAFHPEGRPEARVHVKIARTFEQRRRGLMMVRHLPPSEGMIFLFERDEPQYFWMKNTLIPLDMIFIRADLTVAGVVEKAVPLDLTSRGFPEPVRYVLEVNGGWAAAHGVGAGSRVEFVEIPLEKIE